MPRTRPVTPPYSDALQQRFAQLVPAGMAPLAIFRAVARNEPTVIEMTLLVGPYTSVAMLVALTCPERDDSKV